MSLGGGDHEGKGNGSDIDCKAGHNGEPAVSNAEQSSICAHCGICGPEIPDLPAKGHPSKWTLKENLERPNNHVVPCLLA